jgi:hypothetical protein
MMTANRESDIKGATPEGEFLIAIGPPEVPIGTMEQHALFDRAKGLVARSEKEVQEDWARVVKQAGDLVASARAAVDGYELDEISFELGFTGSGQIAFVASAEISTSISVTFKKK